MDKLKSDKLKGFLASFACSLLAFVLIFTYVLTTTSPLDMRTLQKVSDQPIHSLFSPAQSEDFSLLIFLNSTLLSAPLYSCIINFSPSSGEIILTALSLEEKHTFDNMELTLGEVHNKYGITTVVSLLNEDNAMISRYISMSSDSFVEWLASLGSISIELPHSVTLSSSVSLLEGRSVLDSYSSVKLLEEVHEHFSATDAENVSYSIITSALNLYFNKLATQNGEAHFLNLLNITKTDITHEDYIRRNEDLMFLLKLKKPVF